MKKALLLLSVTFVLSFTVQGQTAGWKNLFDGKSLKGWKRLAGDARFTVEDGMIVGTTVPNSGNTFLATEQTFGDFVLELDVKVENDHLNSGIQTRSHFDPAGHQGRGLVYGRQVEVDPSDRAWSGGIYDEGRRGWLYPLSLDSGARHAFRSNGFNHYHIECIGNETRTWINGVPAADLVDTLDPRGFIALQVHMISDPDAAGKKIWFRNIRIRTDHIVPTPFPPGIFVVDFVPNHLTTYEQRNGWKLLFDGRTSKGWRGAYLKGFPKKDWVVRDGTITVLELGG